MAQATTLEKAFAGPKDSKGRQVYPGFAWDTGLTNTQGLPGLLHGGQVVGGAATTIGMDVDAAVERVLADPAESSEHDLAMDESEHVFRLTAESCSSGTA